ncbi:MAG: phosphoglycerate kinase [Candidatus Nealsonbacteria bacterium]|nr:phosphoglycerate kinase [Candidatus Nealsonbacteria bacterium]
MKTINDFELKGKKVLVRADFNVSLDDQGRISDDFRIKSALPTIEHLIKEESKIILISHLGDPQEDDPQKCTLKPVAQRLEKLLKIKIKFLPDCIGSQTEKEIELMKPGEVVLLENVRFHPEEKKNDNDFAKKLAKLGDIYLNEAFSACHRSHASIVGLPKFLPKGAGLLLDKEIKILSKIKEKPERPLVIVIGGKKSAKIESLPKFLEIGDYVLLNGFLSKSLLSAKGILIDESFSDEKITRISKKINFADKKLHFPKDALFSLAGDWSYRRIGGLGTAKKEEEIFDIGPETIDIYSKIIEKAKTIFWAGPLGYFEVEKFERGTREIGDKIVRNYKAFKVAGGGDTILAIQKFDWMDKFDHISTGGSAMLKFLCGDKMPGIEALK